MRRLFSLGLVFAGLLFGQYFPPSGGGGASFPSGTGAVATHNGTGALGTAHDLALPKTCTDSSGSATAQSLGNSDAGRAA